MSQIVIRLTILFAMLFGWLAMIGGSVYLAIAVFKVPLLVIMLVGMVAGFFVVSFLAFVGEMSPERQGHRYE